MKILENFEDSKKFIENFLRKEDKNDSLYKICNEIGENIRKNGDVALKKYLFELDNFNLEYELDSKSIDKSFSKYLKSYEILPMSENNPYPDILKNIDYAIVTSDSVNMISEISTTPIPLFIHKFPKESGKILYFLNDLQNLGIIKIFENELFQFNKKQLNTNRTTLLKVNKFLGV